MQLRVVKSGLLLGYWRVSKGLEDGQAWLDLAKIACEQLMVTLPALKRMSLQFRKEISRQLLASSVGATGWWCPSAPISIVVYLVV